MENKIMICNHFEEGKCNGIDGDGNPCEGAKPHPHTEKCDNFCPAPFGLATCIPTIPKFVVLKNVVMSAGYKIFTRYLPDTDQTKDNLGNTVYEIIGYANTIEECEKL